MPGKIRKLPGKRKWRVYWGDKVRAFGTTERKAKAQLRLLENKEKGDK